MQPFTTWTGVAAALLRDNVDTDIIIPSREIKAVSRSGLSQGLFAGWRYLPQQGAGDAARMADPSFVLNDAALEGATILLAGSNFGCGSSREQAVWALAEYGFRVLLAPSFGSIFFRNCVCNGLLPAMLPAARIRELAEWTAVDPRRRRPTVDLERQQVHGGEPGRDSSHFEIAADAKDALAQGLDPIAATLRLGARIEEFTAADRQRRPWVYAKRR